VHKLFHFDSPREVYRAGACVISCFDARFELVERKLLKRLGVACADRVRVAGGAKGLSSPNEPAARAFLINQVRLSVRLHAPPVVLLVAHADCGTYGGFQAFGFDAEREVNHHRSELATAAAVLRKETPGLAIRAFFFGFDGAWEVPDA
jgi:hypothetical protein